MLIFELASLASSLMKTGFHVPFSLLELIKIAIRLLVLWSVIIL